MTTYSVKQLANLAGISIRTLHHYDQINLLKPSFRSEKGYRFYERKELLLLQQILFYRELGLSLEDINSIITDPSFELIGALELHKKNLKKRLGTLKELLKTIDKTIIELKNKEMMKDEEIYKGFKKGEIELIRQEVREKWGEGELKETEARIRKMGSEGWNDTHKKGEEIAQLLGDLINLEPDDIKVQKAIELHFRHINLFYDVSKERYLGLGNLYVKDDRFRSYYEKYKEGLAGFIQKAIEIFCANDLQIKE